MATWQIEPDIDIQVLIGPCGPLEDPNCDHVDVTNWVRGQGITISRGRSDEFASFQAGTCEFTLSNDDRRFDPALGAGSLVLTGASGGYASTPDHSTLDITGDIDLRAEATATDWTPAASQTFVAKWNISGSQRSYLFQVTSSGRLRLITSPDGSEVNAILTDSTIALPASGALAVRATRDVNDGGGNKVTRFYTAPTINGPWAQLGTTVTSAGTTSIFNSTAVLEVGASSAGTVERFTGEIRAVQVYDGIDGTLAADPTFSGKSTGTTSFADNTSKTWTVNGTASIVAGSPVASLLKPGRRVEVNATYNSVSYRLFTGYITGWPQTWTTTTGSVDIVAVDLLAVLAGDQLSSSPSTFVLGDPVSGVLGTSHLSGVLDAQFTGERIDELLAFTGVGVGSGFALDTGLAQVAAQEVTGNLLSAIDDTVAAEAGFFYIARDGTVTFLDRHSRFLDSRIGTVQASFTDLQYSNLSVDYDLTQVINDARYVRVLPDSGLIVNVDGTGDFPVELDQEEPDPTEQTVKDETSIRSYGRRVQSATIPVISDAEALGRAEFIVSHYREPKQRPVPIVIRPRRNLPVLFPQVAGRELLDRIQIQRTPLGLTPTVTFTGLVEQLQHRITNETWETTIGVSLIDADEGDAFLRLNNATLGQLGTGILAY